MKNLYEKERTYNWVKGSIRGYLSGRKPGSTLERTIGMIKRALNYATASISKQQLHEILNDDEFTKDRNSNRYKDLTERCKEEDLL